MIEAVFFDFGGVVAQLDRDQMRRLERRHGLPKGGLWRAMYEAPEWQALKAGTGSETDWLEATSRTLDQLAGHAVSDQVLREEWQCWRRLDADIIALVSTLRPRYRVGMISNSKLTLEDELRDELGIYDDFEIVVNSARVGIKKPDTRIYHHAAGQMGVEYAACVHIDDLQPNIDGAIAAGFSAIHYEGHFPALEESLRALGVDW